MIFNSTKPQNYIRDVFPESLIDAEQYDKADMEELLSNMTLENCKLCLIGNDILKKAEKEDSNIKLGAPLSDI